MVMQLPERDKLSMSLEQMTSRLAIMMGGRVAEEMIFGKEKVTSGAASDIEQATRLARMMVTRWGLSDELGTVSYGENQEEVFLGHSVSRQQNVSEQTAQKIDAEIRRLVETGLAEARRILTDHRDELETLAQGLLEYETLSGDEIKNLLAGKPPVRELGDDAASRGSAVPVTKAPRLPGEPKAAGAAAAGLIFPQAPVGAAQAGRVFVDSAVLQRYASHQAGQPSFRPWQHLSHQLPQSVEGATASARRMEGVVAGLPDCSLLASPIAAIAVAEHECLSRHSSQHGRAAIGTRLSMRCESLSACSRHQVACHIGVGMACCQFGRQVDSSTSAAGHRPWRTRRAFGVDNSARRRIASDLCAIMTRLQQCTPTSSG